MQGVLQIARLGSGFLLPDRPHDVRPIVHAGDGCLYGGSVVGVELLCGKVCWAVIGIADEGLPCRDISISIFAAEWFLKRK